MLRNNVERILVEIEGLRTPNPRASYTEHLVRCALLAQALEPFGNKEGCTTRSTDSSPGTKIEYFVAASINGFVPLYAMCKQLATSDSIGPGVVYKAILEAQRNSFLQRGGGKVNSGQLHLIVPVMAWQAQTRCLDWDKSLDGVPYVLRQTNRKDIKYLDKQLEIAFYASRRHRENNDIYERSVSNFECVWDALVDASHLTFIREMVNGFPYVRREMNILLKSEGDLIERSEAIYESLGKDIERNDARADLICLIMYLALVDPSVGIAVRS